MGLIDIPPYVLAGESPPHHAVDRRAFHLRSWEVPEPIAFPREVFAESLAVHARLLEENGADIVDAPAMDGRTPEYLDSTNLNLVCALVVSRGVQVEIHKWRPQEVSYVVHRCRGIVRKLIEEADYDRMYVVVVAAGAASLHVVRARGPKRVGDRARLEVVEPAIVVEPWEQWHRRVGDCGDGGESIITTWTTPAGDAVESRVAAPPEHWTVRAAVDALARIYDPSARKGLAAYRREHRGVRPCAQLLTQVDGDAFIFHERSDVAFWAESFPGLIKAVRTGPRNLDPVMIHEDRLAALFWLAPASAKASTDVAVPPVRFEWMEGRECPGPSLPDLYILPHRLKPPQVRSPEPEPEPGPEYWRERLSRSLSALITVTDVKAPPSIIEQTRETVRKRMAKLEPSDAAAVLRAWPRAARLLGKAEAPKVPARDDEKPN